MRNVEMERNERGERREEKEKEKEKRKREREREREREKRKRGMGDDEPILAGKKVLEKELEKFQKKLNGPKKTAKHIEAKQNWREREEKRGWRRLWCHPKQSDALRSCCPHQFLLPSKNAVLL